MADLIFPIDTLIEHLSECMTLEPGDLIYTGTPAGVSPLGPGNVTRVEMEGFELGRDGGVDVVTTQVLHATRLPAVRCIRSSPRQSSIALQKACSSIRDAAFA